MIIRVSVGFGEPHDLLRIDRHAVHDGRNLPVAAARIETDPASVQMTADRLGEGLFRRGFV